MKKLMVVSAALTALSVWAADVGHVIVRQQWPWSTDVKVEFELSNVTEPTDITIRAYDGTTEFAADKVAAATRGPRYDLRTGGVYTLTIDPTVLVSTETKCIPDFRVTVSAGDAAPSSSEVLYKIVNLEAPYDVEDVTRARLLNGDPELGTVETDFGRIGEGFTTPLEDVVIWTGVTNNVKYKTTHMVLRKIPARNKTFKFLKGLYVEGEGTLSGYDVTLTNDFYIGVFEVTQTQYMKIRSPASGSFAETNAAYASFRPADRLTWKQDLRGAEGCRWPDGSHTDLGEYSFFFRLQSRTGLVFDLPTEAMWEFASRGGTDTLFYSGATTSDLEVRLPLMRARGVNAPDSGAIAPRNCDLTEGSNVVGSYAPNAFGLYDMLGNVSEYCLDVWLDGEIPTGGVDPVGPNASEEVTRRVVRGGSYNSNIFRQVVRRAARQTDYYYESGFRVCLYPDLSLPSKE